MCIFFLFCMAFLLALTAVRLFSAGLFPPFYSCVDLAEKCQCGLSSVAGRRWEGVGEGSICPVLSGLFPPACPFSQLQDHEPAVHLPASRSFPVPQLDWRVTPCSFLDGLRSVCCLKGVGSRTQNSFGWFLVARSAPVSVFGGRQHILVYMFHCSCRDVKAHTHFARITCII